LLDGLRGQPELVLGIAELGPEVIAKTDHVPELLPILEEPAPPRHDRDCRLDPLQPGLLAASRADPGAKLFRLIECLAVGAIGPLPFFARQLMLLELILRPAELDQTLVDPRMLGPGLEQLVQPILERLLRPTQSREPGAGGEEQLAELPLPGAN